MRGTRVVAAALACCVAGGTCIAAAAQPPTQKPAAAAKPAVDGPAAAQPGAEAPAASRADRLERLDRLRNLGKALYENPVTQYAAVAILKEALQLARNLDSDSSRDHLNYALGLLRAGRTEEGVAELEKVQRQAPELPHTWFNLGIAYKNAGRYDDAVAQLRRFVELVPDDAVGHYNLGVLYKLRGDAAASLAAFERAAELDPYLAGPRFQLSTAYRQAGRADDARAAMAAFRELKSLQADDAVEEDLEWSYYAELYDPVDPRPAVVAAAAKPSFEVRELTTGSATAPGVADAAEADSGEAAASGAAHRGTVGLAVLDADGDRVPDLLAWDAAGVRLYLAGSQPAASGLEAVRNVVAVAPGDFDDDGFPDLAVIARSGASLWHNRGAASVGGDAARFAPHATALPETALPETALPETTARPFHDAVWLDFDQDYDLDLFLLGAESTLLRNVGADDAGVTAFEERTAAFPFVAGEALSGTVVDSVADARGMDLAVTYADRSGVLYRDLLGGRYEAVDVAELPAGAARLSAYDLDDDGWTDLAAAARDGSPVLLRNRRGSATHSAGFAPLADLPDLTSGRTRERTGSVPLLFADLDNRGVGDLVSGAALARNLGTGRFAAASRLAATTPAALAGADFDQDGRVDLAALDAGGAPRLLLNRTETANHWLRVELTGKKNLTLAPYAEVEVKAGPLYQKRIYRGVPLLVGLGPYAEADAVRITWPNGLIQNEIRQAAGEAPGDTATYEEAQRLSGSCPMVFAWNGSEMGFVADVLGVAPLGAAAGDGIYFQVDHDEVLALSGEQLVPRPSQDDGAPILDVRLTEELREVGYVDQLHLVAVDHPAGVEVLHNDKFKGPPYPEMKLWGVDPEAVVRPVAARDQRGDDVLPALLAGDRTYAAGVQCDGTGVSTPHALSLDFGAGSLGDADHPAVLVLRGWTDWADGSTFMATAQSAAGPQLHMPVLQMRDAAGDWVTAVADPGVPAGKPKTLVVELPPWPSAWRQIRLPSSMCVYWDEVFLAPADPRPTTRLTTLEPSRADLRFRGFSRNRVHPRRLQPEHFDYEDLQTLAPWDPTPGLYTRYGDVRELLGEVDDRLMVFGAGDELALQFDAAALPPLPEGWRRDYLLVVDGWAKDGDSNTAYGTAVEPLPHRGMAEYPYGAATPFPDDEAHRRWRAEYQTRPALRLHRPWGAPPSDRSPRAGRRGAAAEER